MHCPLNTTAVLLSINLYNIDGIWNNFLSGTPRIESRAAGCEAITLSMRPPPPFKIFIFIVKAPCFKCSLKSALSKIQLFKSSVFQKFNLSIRWAFKGLAIYKFKLYLSSTGPTNVERILVRRLQSSNTLTYLVTINDGYCGFLLKITKRRDKNSFSLLLRMFASRINLARTKSKKPFSVSKTNPDYLDLVFFCYQRSHVFKLVSG